MKYKFMFVVFALSFLLSACGASGTDVGVAESAEKREQDASLVQQISAQAAHERIQSGEPVVIIDVRTAEEYEAEHIPGAILIPNETIDTVRPELLPVLDAEILIYCRSGNRSAQAAEKLSTLGYTNLYDFGGINGWSYETEAGAWKESEKDGSLMSFTAYDLNGVAYDESVFLDKKLTMVNIWATFCGPCLREMPELGEIAADYQEKNVQIIGLLVDVPPGEDGSFSITKLNEARQIAAETGADYLHLLPDARMLSVGLGGVTSVPTTIFFDGDGKQVGGAYVGARSGEDWIEIIDALLEEVEA